MKYAKRRALYEDWIHYVEQGHTYKKPAALDGVQSCHTIHSINYFTSKKSGFKIKFYWTIYVEAHQRSNGFFEDKFPISLQNIVSERAK